MPDSCTLPKPLKAVSVVETYSSAQFFNWGMILPGVEISLQWDLMSTEKFNFLDQIFAQNGTVIWQSEIQNKDYEVLLSDFTGVLINGADGEFRQDVTMNMYIISEVN